jgi:hypothetical protein
MRRRARSKRRFASPIVANTTTTTAAPTTTTAAPTTTTAAPTTTTAAPTTTTAAPTTTTAAPTTTTAAPTTTTAAPTTTTAAPTTTTAAPTTTTAAPTTTTAAPSCGIMPNVVGLSETAASNAIVAQGIAYEFTYYIDNAGGATSQNNQKVASQDPAAGTNVGSCNFSYNASLTIYNYTAPATTTTAAPTTTTAAPTTTTAAPTTTTAAPTTTTAAPTTTTAAPACVCNYTDMGSYHYSPQCCPGGSQRTGSLSGTTTNACCPNVTKTQKWQCKSFDVTNSASANYSTCYSVGECAANFNSDGSRTICYV